MATATGLVPELSETVAAKVPFSELCGLIERISRNRKNDSKKSLLTSFLNDWRATHARIHGDEDTPAAVSDSFFPAMRLLLSQCDKARVAYGIKEHVLAKHYIDLLRLGKESPDALKLLNYKSPRHTRAGMGDFAEVAYFVLKNRCPEKGTLTVKDVNDCLTGIAEGNSSKQKDRVQHCLMRLLKNLSALEQKWLIRMIMKELKCGISQTTILSVFHEDAEALYDVTQDLEKVCRQLADPAKRLHEISIDLFQPFRPMLAERGDPSGIERQMSGRPFLLEIKLDGERVQLHKDADHYRYWSRNGNEWTSTYGESPFKGNLTPFLHTTFKRHVRNCIIDGEMMGYNIATKTMGSKAEEFDIKRPSTESSTGYTPCFIAFDLVYLNDEVLTNRPLEERKKLLDDLFTPVEGRMMISKWKKAKTKEECVEEFNKIIDDREEGLMAKTFDSVYSVASRKGGWFKLKPDYVIGLSDELDCLVIGGYFGSGHRAGMVAEFLCGVAVPSREEGGRPKVFQSFCKVGTGYSKATLYDYNRRMADHWKPFSKTHPPTCIELTTTFRERPEVWIEPEKSFIVQIRAAEIVASDSYRTGCTLRFPRVECFREDKSWFECVTTKELEELRAKSEGKLAHRHVTLGAESGDEGTSGIATKRRRVATKTALKPTVLPQFKPGVDASQIDRVSSLFSGREICVMTVCEPQTKEEVERKVIQGGGCVVQNPGRNTYCVVADRRNLKVNNLIRKSTYDVVKSDWIIRCADVGRLTSWRPEDMVHTSPATSQRMAEGFDRFGDSFTEEVDVDGLRAVFERMEEQKMEIPQLSSSERCDLIATEFGEPGAVLGVLTGCRVFLSDQIAFGDPATRLADWASGGMGRLSGDVRLAGAQLVDSPEEEGVTHVIVDPATTDDAMIEELKGTNRLRSRRFHMVSTEWAKECIKQGRWLNERPYHV